MRKEKDHFNSDSMRGFSHTFHTSSYRSHATSTGFVDIEYTDEIIEFNKDQETEIKEYLNSN